ncbi:hypothetical protein CC1G_14552 [Coprinopsis cinerea okayama7|uniref:Uncharacterized protein n=1 Tax=Coprinopsis cinerea (strain Okayama-7 / 130 / ATCC MYA-4618 / FGSC 9003) TaxID=240176 RepID=D6RMF8_COPC7|nr:hypothetical protein CC1G_14552 [Coprinopsis cinerea okayama7\|eukprot:XP_002911120.1 hypothetical protein CC1G_14552 [Coprinopsis cinerea okayama7\
MSSAPEPCALLPLTVFDRVFERTTFVTGWLVEGTVDAAAIDTALREVTDKWRMLAGRVQSIRENNETKWFIRVPLGPLPSDYPTFALTETTSTVPLSTYVTTPIPQVSNSLPPELFVHPSTPRQYTAWERTSHPLTCWHLTYFPASLNADGKAYTAIGFARSHGVFDGLGAAMVTKALVAELKGEEWAIPKLPAEGLNANPLVQRLEEEVKNTSELLEYKGYSILGLGGFLKLIAWQLRERFWRGADRRIVLVPKSAFDALIGAVKTALQERNQDPTSVSSGDVLVAWIYKTVYSLESSESLRVHCSNVAAIRSYLTNNDPDILAYPHNAFIPIPYPTLTAAELRSLPLPDLTSQLADHRRSLSKGHVLSAYQMLKTPTILFPNHPEADDDLMISNVSASRILQTDWTLAGSKKTVCGYRYQLTPTKVVFTNAVYIAGRLDDGTVVLDVSLNKAKFDVFVREVERLCAEGS